jgi:acetolactate synthase I/II/III large subunit
VARSKKSALNRRNFLQSATVGVATLAAASTPARAQQIQPGTPRVTAPNATTPSAAAREAETGTPPSNVEILTNERPGSDFMVDVLKSLGIEYICSNPGSSFRALHESVINYGGNRNPEFLTCCHEESAVGMAHGYAKVEGKPLAVFAHGTVGLQHAAMAIYNAYCDRVPVYVIFGNIANAENRRPGVEWAHSVQDGAALVRDFTKWDDAPASLTHFAESAVRAYKIAMTPPMMPIVLVADGDLQEDAIAEDARLSIPKLTLAAPPQGESGAVAEAAQLLWAAESPVIIADRAARTPAGMALLVELAEVLQAPVIDQGGRMNFPTRHPLNHTERSRVLVPAADVILGLELTDFWGTVHSYRDQLQRTSQSMTKPGAKLISITAGDLFLHSNYQDFERYPEVDLAIAADTEATLPSLIEAVKRLITADRKRVFDDRGAKLAASAKDALDRMRTEATYAWDASPISTARLSAELWAQIKNDDWSLVSDVPFVSRWPLRLWNFDKHYQYLGGSGGAGVGYGAPAAVGAALANRKRGRLSVSIQNDGDLMYAPAVLWTAAHHKIPLLSVMHNNRAYHQELMHVQRMANRHNRGIDRAVIGTTLEDPNIDYSKIAQGLGVHAEGPITDPMDLGPAIQRAVEIVRRGEPALVDVVTQPR